DIASADDSGEARERPDPQIPSATFRPPETIDRSKSWLQSASRKPRPKGRCLIVGPSKHREFAMSELRNRVALVTGGSRGIGRAIASALAEAGAAVAVNYRERREEAAAVVESIDRAGGRAVAVAADVSSAAAVKGMVREI